MKAKVKPWTVQNNKCFILKMSIMILSTVFVLHLLRNHQIPLVHRTKSTIVETMDSSSFSKTQISKQVDDSLETHMNEEGTTSGQDSAGECDLFTGEWISNPEGPSYTNDTCKFIEDQQNCMMNGRQDLGYLKWRWRPRDCELPPFDAKKFLDMMRNKVWALIGDSISRNHVQSLLCTLSKVEEPVYIYHDEGYKSRGWRFPSHNLTVYVFWSPFLVEATIYEDSNREIELHLDRLDKTWTQIIKNLDYIIFSTGKWFLKTAIYYENNEITGCHYCPKLNLTEVGFDFAYRKALRNTFDFIAKSGHKGVIFFRTCTPSHFEGGEWYNGGKCNRTVPFKEGEIKMSDLHQILRRIELEEYESASRNASQNGVQFNLLDVMQLSLLRADGHPGLYRSFHPLANKNKDAIPITDCLHWCLPGPIDSWNDVMMQMLVN